MANTPIASFRLDAATKRKLQALAAISGTTMTDVIRQLAQEAPMTGVSITYSVETDPDVYTTESEHEQYVPALVDRIESELADYMAAEYPGIEFETRRVPERSSVDNRSRVDVAQDDGNYTAEQWGLGVIAELDIYVADNWLGWLEQAVPA